MLLEIKELRKSFGGVRAIDGVSFAIDAERRVFLIGPNGAGKTTLVNLISGYLRPDSGAVIFRGKNVSGLDMRERSRLGIARSFQLVNVFWNLTVEENLAMSVASRKGITLKPFPPLRSHREVLEEAAEVAKAFGLEGSLDMLPTELSQGDRKVLDVAMALALRPRLLLLDEPTSGVATRDKFAIMERILAAVESYGAATIIVEHDMDVVFNYAERVLVLHHGKLIADGDPEKVRSREDVRSVLLGGIYA
ncbi:MAG: ABC transporter ATP-binding protein [Acidilobaceae archaeon]|nr:ABC transporter ATP-binding protein [Acidilobaceae archaeon]MCX8165270.1 ABC transporter ATP-binding protein [Acidilobaceae archaeon]MDW7973696.1 ABC transporter ATP-binding protein [Sulfolobales archaeon]